MPKPRSEREFALEVVRTLRQAGHEALFAGGCVRDELLGLVPQDYDVATSARPEQVQQLFRRTVAVGAAFGVIDVIGPRPFSVQVATFRTDGTYSDSRRPDQVVFCSAEEDAKRRDFTINGMFLDPLENRVIDYVGGQADLANRVLRAIGQPRERFAEDHLRLLRAVRMASRFELTVEPVTDRALRDMAPLLGTSVSAERIAEELRKILTNRHRARGMQLFMEYGLAKVILPELVPMCGLPQGPPRPDGPPLPILGQAGDVTAFNGTDTLDLWQHTLRVLEYLEPDASFPLAFAALLHDVGKPRTVGRTPDRYTFYNHEHVGRRIAGQIANRLRLSNQERQRIEWLVEKHQILADAPQMRPAKLKPLLVHPGYEELIALHIADARACGRSLEHIEWTRKRRQEWEQAGTLWPEPILSGDDLIALGLQPGPQFRTLLETVRSAQLDGTIFTREQAMQMIRELALMDAG
jgi:poly(A) polymerase